jgi:hypothetical protein
MQKVVGSSPIIRFAEPAGNAGFPVAVGYGPVLRSWQGVCAAHHRHAEGLRARDLEHPRAPLATWRRPSVVVTISR